VFAFSEWVYLIKQSEMVGLYYGGNVKYMLKFGGKISRKERPRHVR
jgi:hypothetical protein